MIAARAVDGALRGIREDIFFERSLTNFFGDGGFLGERIARRFILHELDALEKAEAADLANVWVRFDGGESLAQGFTDRRDAIEELVSFEVVEDGVAGSGGNGMRLIRETMHESSGAFLVGFDDVRRNENRAEGSITAGNSLSGQDDVRFESPMLRGKWFAGTAHAGHDFVGDEKNSVFAADIGDARGVTIYRGNRAERGTDDGFKDESGNGGGIVGEEKSFEIVGAGEIAFRISFAEGTVIAEAGSDVAPFRNHRRIRSAAPYVAADRHGPEGAAVIALPARDDTEAGWLLALQEILAD